MARAYDVGLKLSSHLQCESLSGCGLGRLAHQRLPIKKGRGKHTLYWGSALPVWRIYGSPTCNEQPHEVWSGLIRRHVDRTYVLVIPPEVLTCNHTSSGQHARP